MVNVADGTAQDYEDLIAYVIDKVEQTSGVRLEREVRIIGEKNSKEALRRIYENWLIQLLNLKMYQKYLKTMALSF